MHHPQSMARCSFIFLICLSLASHLQLITAQHFINPAAPSPFVLQPHLQSVAPTLALHSTNLIQPEVSASCTALGLTILAALDLPACRGFHYPSHFRQCTEPASQIGVRSRVLVNDSSAVSLDALSIQLQTTCGHHIFNTSNLIEISALNSDSPITLAPGVPQDFLTMVEIKPLTGVYDVVLRLEAQVHGMLINCSLNSSVLTVEATCSNGLFCDGDEKFVGGECVQGTPPCTAPASDTNNCVIPQCHEQFGTCQRTLRNDTECAQLTCGGSRCEPTCPHNAQCGGDGCGGRCGVCQASFECRNFSCMPAVELGTCARPIDLLPLASTQSSTIASAMATIGQQQTLLLGEHELYLDLKDLGDQAWPACTEYGQLSDAVARFTVPAQFKDRGLGVDARLHGRYNPELDTVMEIRRDRCEDLPRATIDPDDTQPETGPDFVCSDDSEPPGGRSSRIVALLKPATYYLIATINPPQELRSLPDGQSVLFPADLPSNRSDFQLRLNIRFVDGYMPDCRLKECGNDGTQANGCGLCSQGQVCNADFKCESIVCVPNCEGKVCGTNGCSGSCGSCARDYGCSVDQKQCLFDPQECNGLKPMCTNHCTDQQYCAADCSCHDMQESLPDLLPKLDDLIKEMSVIEYSFPQRACAFKEQCLMSWGRRRLLRFTVSVLNQGEADLELLRPDTHPLSFTWSPCHQHWHYRHFASYDLMSKDQVVARGHKQAFCLEDSAQSLSLPGPDVPCLPKFNCTSPGIQRGWSDRYGAELECQWIDVTDLPRNASYELRVEVNNERAFVESSYENNVVVVPVHLP